MFNPEEIQKWLDLMNGENVALLVLAAIVTGAWYFRKDVRMYLKAQTRQAIRSSKNSRAITAYAKAMTESSLELKSIVAKLANADAASVAAHAKTHVIQEAHAKESDANHKKTHEAVHIVKVGVSEILEKVAVLQNLAATNPKIANIKPDLAQIEQGAVSVEKKSI